MSLIQQFSLIILVSLVLVPTGRRANNIILVEQQGLSEKPIKKLNLAAYLRN